jgi:hypothetical protein
MRWLAAFLFTQLVEIPIYLWAMRGRELALPRVPKVVVAFGATALTHPIVWFVFPQIISFRHYVWMVAAAEAFAILTEAYVLHVFAVRRPLLWAFVANAASAGIGLALERTFGWF